MSNDSPAFDVLSADENDLWEWAVERAGVEHAATYIRDAAEAAVRARLMRCGGSDAGLAYGKLRKEYDAQRAELKECVAKLKALRESRDTDLARARREGIREGLTQYADAPGCGLLHYSRTIQYRDGRYPLPTPKPAECRLSDGSVVTFHETTAGSCGSSFWRTRNDGGATMNGDWRGLLTRPTDTGADFDALKAFAATPTEDTTDGR